MTDEELLQKWIAEHEAPEICQYCMCDDDCNHGAVCYGGEPIFPACAETDNIEELLDTDSIIEDIKAEMHENAMYAEHIMQRFTQRV